MVELALLVVADGVIADEEVAILDAVAEQLELTSSDVRMPSGNETGANDSWIPFGHLPTGIPEGVHEKNGLPHFGTDIPLR